MAADSSVCESWSILRGGDSGGFDNGVRSEVERRRFMDGIGSRSSSPVFLILSCHMLHRLGEEGSFIFLVVLSPFQPSTNLLSLFDIP